MSRNINVRSELIDANKKHEAVSDENSRLILIDKEDFVNIFLIKEGRLSRIKQFPKDSDSGKIILARVINVKKDIEAAFVKISENDEAFLKLSNVPKEYPPLKQGDLIPVKIISDKQKGKRISVSALVGKKKLPEGFMHKAAFNVLYEPKNSLLDYLKSRFSLESIEKVLTESEEIFEMLSPLGEKVSLYRDEKINLSKLYSLKSKLEEAKSSKVYLKSGAYLVIGFTEALTVIDVNSGKKITSGKKDSAEVIKAINDEAAKEVAFILSQRNISGMILVDFINMESPEDEEYLLSKMEEYVSEDNVTVKVIDITPLGIMEITRQKTDKPLTELNIEL
ncbi:MAG: ribonuclease E/G [Lachnospiraceae bacterium]|nr:ribonuclease E/G [Lachnospiraceae bacterium]